MADVSCSSLAIVAAVAFSVPFLLGVAPALRLPAAVLEILLGIAIGPFGLRWVKAAGLLSVLLFPAGALVLLRGEAPAADAALARSSPAAPEA